MPEAWKKMQHFTCVGPGSEPSIDPKEEVTARAVKMLATTINYRMNSSVVNKNNNAKSLDYYWG